MAATALRWPRAVEAETGWSAFERAPLELPAEYIVLADVTGFYETVSHEILADRLLTLTGKTALVDAIIEFLTRVMGEPRGLPQGLAASDTLATVYLSGIDAGLLRRGYRYWRHGDDIRIAVSNHDTGRRAVHDLESELRGVRLLVNAEKTRVLKRETYERHLRSVDDERERVHATLVRRKEEGLLGAEQEQIEELIEQAGIDEETQWGLLYHGNISLDEIVEQLRPHLEPDKIEIATAVYDDAMRRAPDSADEDRLPAELFHGQLSSSLTTLIAAEVPHAIKDAANLIFRFPAETELIATYLRALAKTHTSQVERATLTAMTNGYLLGWQQGWLLQVLRAVADADPFISGEDEIAQLATSIAGDEAADWLSRAEAARLLAQRDALAHEVLWRLWTRAPAPVRPELAAAAATMAVSSSENAWAHAFVDSLSDDPLIRVVLHHVSPSSKQQNR